MSSVQGRPLSETAGRPRFFPRFCRARLFFGPFITRGNSRRAALGERRVYTGKAQDVSEKLALPPAPLTLRNVMGGEAAADVELGKNRDKIVLVPFLVGVAEDEVKRPWKGRDEFVRVGQPGVDVGR